MGITFRVYQDDSNSSDNRTWPLDFIPRLIKKERVENGRKGIDSKSKSFKYVH